MSKHVPLMRLVEHVQEDGRITLSGRLGMSEVIGFRGRPTREGNENWIISVVRPGNQVLDRQRAYHNRTRARAEGVVEVGGWDG